jgi:BirA family transcriptional regulator, biotin operon repressor / biotin---[acetyl-CoA-carboxylase] ligase
MPEPLAHAIPKPLADALARSRDRLGVFASNVRFFSTVESTNDVAASAASEAEGLVVIADQQTAGRGRRGHTWFSPPGAGLYVSVVLVPSRSADPRRATTLLTLAAGVALVEAIESQTGLHIDLKWPNDLFVGSKKIGGILAEARANQRRSVVDTRAINKSGAPREIENVDIVVLGYGLNVRAIAYPVEIGERATSLESELGRAVDRDELIVETLAALSARYEDLVAARFDAILDAWRRRAPAACGARVTWTTTDGPQSGVTAGIDDDGALRVQVGERVERIVGGEVRWS